VLVLVGRVAGHEADSTVADCEAKALASLVVDAAGGHGVEPAAGRIGFVVPVEDLPALGVALGPLGQHESGDVCDWHLHAISTDGVQAQADVMDHANVAEVLAQVAALRPQQRLVIVVRVEVRQPHLKSMAPDTSFQYAFSIDSKNNYIWTI